MTRYIAITDIHGELEKFERLLSKIKMHDDDVFVFMGDYIDRGSNSKGVIDKVIEISQKYKTITLIGSHEYAYLHSETDEYYNYLFKNYGGPATVRSYGGFDKIYETHGSFFDNLKFYHLTDNYLFVHAGINPKYDLEHQNEVDLVYIRGTFFNHPHNLKQKIIFGHTEFEQPFIRDDKIGIDLGCGKYKNAKLCALILDNGKEEFVITD